MKGTVYKRAPEEWRGQMGVFILCRVWIQKDGERLRDQRTKSGFRTKREAANALRKAI